MSAQRCECGFKASMDMSLRDHLHEAFTPMDGVAADGIIHDESAVALACLCGFSCQATSELDDHLLAVFTSADRVGLDGKRHAMASDEARGLR